MYICYVRNRVVNNNKNNMQQQRCCWPVGARKIWNDHCTWIILPLLIIHILCIDVVIWQNSEQWLLHLWTEPFNFIFYFFNFFFVLFLRLSVPVAGSMSPVAPVWYLLVAQFSLNGNKYINGVKIVNFEIFIAILSCKLNCHISIDAFKWLQEPALAHSIVFINWWILCLRQVFVLSFVHRSCFDSHVRMSSGLLLYLSRLSSFLSYIVSYASGKKSKFQLNFNDTPTIVCPLLLLFLPPGWLSGHVDIAPPTSSQFYGHS